MGMKGTDRRIQRVLHNWTSMVTILPNGHRSGFYHYCLHQPKAEGRVCFPPVRPSVRPCVPKFVYDVTLDVIVWMYTVWMYTSV